MIDKFPFFLHGGDYNPDQWRHVPGTVDEDFRLFKLAGINSVSVGIFSWAALEPEEGRYEFGWLDDIMDRCARDGMAVVLATPSGAKPNWMAQKYSEIRRVARGGAGDPGERQLQHGRHNHCPTSPIYREKTVAIDTALAKRYAGHPALALWHISNEFNRGECYCPLCKAAFREWLRAKYGSLDALNQAWWTGFWAHTYTDWEQIDSVDSTLDGLVVDWWRFRSAQMTSFLRCEVEALKSVTPDVPVTTNFMGFFDGLDYWRMAKELDIVSWDCYPQYHDRPGETERTAARYAMVHDLNRSLLGKPFLLMESSPGPVNWYHHNRLLRPGMHRMKSLQAVAHGSDSVQYFQIRKGRGGAEKFHGAVIDHEGSERPRMFKEVAQVGHDLEALRPVLGATTKSEVGIIADWESCWHLQVANGPIGAVKGDASTNGLPHYLPYWRRGINVDILNGDSELDGYKVVIAPALFMLRDGFAERVEKFVEAGGTFIATWLTGIVNETGLCFRGGYPGTLRKVLGIWAEETDYLYEDETNEAMFADGNYLGATGRSTLKTVCDVVHLEGAEAVATYGHDFYAGTPVITRNVFGKGQAIYIAAHGDDAFYDSVHGALAERLGLRRALTSALPYGVTASVREKDGNEFVFVQNFASEPKTVDLGAVKRKDLLSGDEVSGETVIPAYGTLVLARP